MGMITAHSGCDHTPDNSIEFVCYVLEHQADCFEVDVRRLGDKLILSHDESAEESVVELRKVFQLLKEHSTTKINCDLKEADLEEVVYELAEEVGVTEQLIYTGTVWPDKFVKGHVDLKGVEVYLNIENISEYFAQVYTGQAFSTEKALEEMECLKKKINRFDVCGLNMNYRLCTDEILDSLENGKIGCSAWTVNEIEEVERLLDRNICNITTRNFYEAESLRRQKNARV